MDPFTLILVVLLIVLFFPLFIRGIGCLIKTVVMVFLVIVAISLLMSLL
ncbi:hypothetical protein [Alkalicoccus daliensis]|uniref:Uncharacterized protein n=1 Tax=Alkalicoccus daliensis TaxID=745820 RepID=A0A1H0F2D5_9BACI|nr:hypothetical protein [Alkalicoccus daliensis]SDN88709.1 hypothetical protein SAMN04488053_104160 [Alkalicoccus daliensis]